MSLEQAIAEWDKKSVVVIRDIYAKYHTEDDFLKQLVELMAQSDYQNGATWLVKHHLETSDQTLTAKQSTVICMHINELVHWESKLHILQIMGDIQIPKTLRDKVVSFVRTCLDSQEIFVRAWGYSAFYEVSKQFPQYHDEAINLLRAAPSRESAGSIKGRVRQIIKKNKLQI